MRTLLPSATVSINAMATHKRAMGERIYNLAAGDPVLKNHPRITDRAVQETAKGHCPYPPVEGIGKLRQLAADWMNSTYKTQYSIDNVLVTCGGKFALFAMINSLLSQDEEVLIPAPYWVSYPDIVKMAGGNPKIVLTSANISWKLTAQNLLKHITKKTKIVILNNACNPTGVVYTREEIKAILDIAKTHHLIVISDEVYSGIVYEEPGFISCGSFPEHRERVLIIQSCSKNFGMTGWRVGFAMGPESIIKRLTALQSQSTSGVSVISQWAAIGALENADEVSAFIRDSMRQRRDYFIQNFNAIFPGHIEEIKSALYAFVPLKSLGLDNITDSASFCEQVMRSDNIALVPGSAFGIEGYVRFAFSETEEEIYQALQALKKAVGRLTGVQS